MWEPLILAVDNLRANKLRSFLTMFGILWGVVSIVMLSAMGEGFRRGNHQILREFGKNIAIVWASRTGMQAGGERAGRMLYLTVADARAIAAQSRLVDSLSPELQQGGVKAKSAYNAATVMVHGVEPPYEDIRTIEVDLGRRLNWEDETAFRHVCLVGYEISKQLFGERYPIDEQITLNGVRYTVVGRLRRKDQDSNYSGPDNGKIFIPFSVILREMPRTDAPLGTLSQIIVTPRPWVVADMPRTLATRSGRVGDIDWPLAQEIRAILARRKGFDPADRDAIPVWDTSLSTLFFDRLIDNMRQFFMAVGFVTLALGGIGLMNIMLIAVKDRTREIGVRKALGATTRVVARQFFLEGLCLTVLSGGAGILIGAGLCALVNLLPLPARFAGMIVTWQTVAVAIATLAAVGIAASTLPARRAAELPPTEALRYEM